VQANEIPLARLAASFQMLISTPGIVSMSCACWITVHLNTFIFISVNLEQDLDLHFFCHGFV
jgi:hypothetical protein